jgi:hypothetical protein
LHVLLLSVATTQQQMTVLVNRPRGVHFDDSTPTVVTVPQVAVDAASAAQKEQGVRNPLLRRYFRRKLDDSTDDVQVIG